MTQQVPNPIPVVLCDKDGRTLDSGTFIRGPLAVVLSGPNAQSIDVTSGAVSGASMALPTAGTQAPANTIHGEAPAGTHAVLWVQDEKGAYHEQAAIDTADATGNPPAPNGTLTFCRRTWFNDSGQPLPPGKNAFVAIYHAAGVGTNQLNQDRALHVEMRDDPADNRTIHGMEAIQAQVYIQGTPTFTNVGQGPDSEVAAGSFQTADFHVGQLSAPSFGITGVRAHVFREQGCGGWGSTDSQWTGLRAYFSNVSTAPHTGLSACAILAQCGDATGTKATIPAIAVYIKAPAPPFATNYGLYIDPIAGASDYALFSAGGRAHFAGNVDAATYRLGTAGPTWTSGTGSPEGVLTAPVGSLYSRTDGGQGTTLYVKESGAGNTGWIAK